MPPRRCGWADAGDRPAPPRDALAFSAAAILEAARSLGCEVVLSEDFGDGQDYDGVRVENPFSVR